MFVFTSYHFQPIGIRAVFAAFKRSFKIRNYPPPSPNHQSLSLSNTYQHPNTGRAHRMHRVKPPAHDHLHARPWLDGRRIRRDAQARCEVHQRNHQAGTQKRKKGIKEEEEGCKRKYIGPQSSQLSVCYWEHGIDAFVEQVTGVLHLKVLVRYLGRSRCLTEYLHLHNIKPRSIVPSCQPTI